MYFSMTVLQIERTVVNIHGRENEKALEKGARGRVPRMSQQVFLSLGRGRFIA